MYNCIYVCDMYVWYACMYGMFVFQVLRDGSFATEWFVFTKAKFVRMISRIETLMRMLV